MELHFTDQNFQKEVTDAKGLALVDFFAPWCGPCKIMGPIIEELANENKNANIKIGKLNVDESPETSEKFGVMSIPTIIIFKDGKEVKRMTGARGKEELSELLSH